MNMLNSQVTIISNKMQLEHLILSEGLSVDKNCHEVVIMYDA